MRDRREPDGTTEPNPRATADDASGPDATTDAFGRVPTEPPRLVLVVGATETARIDGISAAGASSDLLAHTPAADAELVTYGRPAGDRGTPVSPTGCPTPALVTRAVRELVGFESLVVEAGLATRTAAPTVVAAEKPGADVRDPEPVPDAAGAFERARTVGRALPDREVLIGESVPGGTTTALGVLRALGEPFGVSSSLATNPVERKRAIVERGLEASGLEPGGAAGEPRRAIRLAGDPVLAAVAGVATGALETGTAVTLAGGTQLVAAAAALRHETVDSPIDLATTRFVADDDSTDVRAAAEALDLSLAVTDPGFDGRDHPAFAAYCRGEAKEGVGMGGALALAERAGVGTDAVRQRIRELYAEVILDGP